MVQGPGEQCGSCSAAGLRADGAASLLAWAQAVRGDQTRERLLRAADPRYTLRARNRGCYCREARVQPGHSETIQALRSPCCLILE